MTVIVLGTFSNAENDTAVDGELDVPRRNAFGLDFRDFEKESLRNAIVQECYRKNHIYQTCEFANKKKEEYGKLDKAEMSIWECCELLKNYVDESDPDLDEPQIDHLLQTAEAIRRDHPHEYWLQLTALIHDLGKVLLHPAFGEEPQWCVVGDTFPLGCAFDNNIVHHQFFKENPDSRNPAFNTKLGIYSENIGLDNITMSWAMHRHGAYTFVMNDEDKEMLKWLQVFNKYDLYSKSKVKINQEEVKPYYLSLIKKYFPEKLKW
ncbi:Inositol oxygenase 1 [Citrus sinensis]|uniref:Inositol oxygenase 1 n=1 Tax=Citrus sinensis TaxID=2711 RepID=A0ACB8NSN9_CITSI|nr:Inositol oxygenase 1 [Citrus sinensis]